MGLVEQTLRNWVKQFDVGKVDGAGAAKVTPEQIELSGLRADPERAESGLDVGYHPPVDR